ncbi:MAG: MarR family transcriptional regulator [Bdellovibrionales bacterium]|nr:MarR family transcriptional regulator [Bdellovibrionales bacterium]
MAQVCEPLFLDRQLCFSIYTASRLMTQAYQKFLGPADLTYPQYIVLLVLWERDGLSVTEVGKRLSLDSGTLSPLLKKLEMKNLIRRTRDKQDERTVLLSLTPQAQNLKMKMAKVPEGMACLTQIPLAELVRIKKKLDAFSDDLRRNQEEEISENKDSVSRKKK